MVQDVVPCFVPNHQERFILVKFLQSVIPDDDALAGSETGYVGVERLGLGAGVHLKDARARNVEPGVAKHLLDARREHRLSFLEGSESVKERVEDHRLDQNEAE